MQVCEWRAEQRQVIPVVCFYLPNIRNGDRFLVVLATSAMPVALQKIMI
jgi:hypothetical protein